jgi:hypothetical protein
LNLLCYVVHTSRHLFVSPLCVGASGPLFLPSHEPLALGSCAPVGLLRVSSLGPLVAFAYRIGCARASSPSNPGSPVALPLHREALSAGTAVSSAHTHTHIIFARPASRIHGAQHRAPSLLPLTSLRRHLRTSPTLPACLGKSISLEWNTMGFIRMICRSSLLPCGIEPSREVRYRRRAVFGSSVWG